MTPTIAGVSGVVRYGGSGNVLSGVLLQASATPGSESTLSGPDGAYHFALVDGAWRVEPQSDVPVNDAITAADAQAILAWAVGSAAPSPLQALAAEVSGNGTISSYDAALVLLRSAGATAPFPIAASCGVTTVYQATAGGDGVGHAAQLANGCARGAATFDSIDGNGAQQDFDAILLGDVDASWQP